MIIKKKKYNDLSCGLYDDSLLTLLVMSDVTNSSNWKFKTFEPDQTLNYTVQ